MARPVQADAAKTRARILEAAGVAFADRGVGSTSIRQVAAAAEVSLAMVHHYFGSKSGLYEACINAMYAELTGLRSELAQVFESGSDVGAIIDRAVRVGFRFGREHQVAVRLLFREISTLGQLDQTRQEAHQRPFLDDASTALALLTGRPAADLRLPLQSATMLVARYCISSERELALFTDDAEQPLDTIEAHLVAAVRALIPA